MLVKPGRPSSSKKLLVFELPSPDNDLLFRSIASFLQFHSSSSFFLRLLTRSLSSFLPLFSEKKKKKIFLPKKSLDSLQNMLSLSPTTRPSFVTSHLFLFSCFIFKRLSPLYPTTHPSFSFLLPIIFSYPIKHTHQSSLAASLVQPPHTTHHQVDEEEEKKKK